MILLLVTGFLGSGKTTLLRQLSRRHRRRRLAFLVNEFSSVDVDGALLSREVPRVLAIPGGSIFCRCLVTEFMQALKDLPARFGSGLRPLEGVVVEASGMANPRVAGRMLEETGLDRQYELASVVTVVDPGSFLKLLRTLPNIRAQVEAADVVLLNKVDAYPEAQVRAAEAALREIRPRLEIIRTCRCETDLDLLAARSRRRAAGEYARCADPSFRAVNLRLPHGVELGRLRGLLGSAAGGIFRAKGFVRSGGEWLHVDYSASGLVTRKTAPRRGSRLVFILDAKAEPDAEDWEPRIRGALGG